MAYVVSDYKLNRISRTFLFSGQRQGTEGGLQSLLNRMFIAGFAV